jgi:small basic protein
VTSEFNGKWKNSVVLLILKVSSPAKFSDYRPISLLVCLSKLFEVLMARQMERHIRCNNLLTVFQSGFRRHKSTAAAVLKVTEDIRLRMEDGKVMVLLLLYFSQAFDMVLHGLLLCKLRNAQNYSVGAGMLVLSYLDERAQFVRSGGQESSVGAVTCGVSQ